MLKQDGLMFDGDPASPEAIDSILSAMRIGMEMAKQKNKEKYTPKSIKGLILMDIKERVNEIVQNTAQEIHLKL